MGIVASREGLDLEGTRVRVIKEMVSEPQRRIGALTATVRIPAGRRFSAEDRVRLERSAHTCPVRQSLHPDVRVEIRFEYPE
jgi:uncharacterized OsmC-like protein